MAGSGGYYWACVLGMGEAMNQEMQKVMEYLVFIYGSNLQAATITVLLKDGDTAVRYLTSTLPQKEQT